jgi:hypothetical protein
MTDYLDAFRASEARMLALRKERSATAPATIDRNMVARDRRERERAERTRRRSRDLTEPRYVRALEMAAKHRREALREPARKG